MWYYNYHNKEKVTTEPNTTTNSQHNLTNTIENMDPNFLNVSNSSCQNTSTIHHSNLQCSKKCYVAILHHNILNLLSNFNALQTFPKKFHDNVLHNPPPPPSLCSTVVFNAINMLPQQFHITTKLQSMSSQQFYSTMPFHLP